MIADALAEHHQAVNEQRAIGDRIRADALYLAEHVLELSDAEWTRQMAQLRRRLNVHCRRVVMLTAETDRICEAD